MARKPQAPERRSVKQPQSATVFSYHNNRAGADTARARYEPPATHRTGFNRLKHLPSLVATIIIVGSLGYASLLSAAPRLQISATDKGASLQRKSEVYTTFLESEFSKSVLNKSKLTFNSTSTIEAFQRQYPEVASVAVSLPLLGHKPIVRIAVSSPAFILASQNGAYYVSDNGTPLVRVADVKNQLEGVLTVTDESNVPISIGKQVLPTKTVKFISSVLQYLETAAVPIESVTLPTEANELQVRLSGQAYVIRFNTIEDARTQVGTLLAVQKRLQGSGEVPKEYIDLRVEERAYYK